MFLNVCIRIESPCTVSGMHLKEKVAKIGWNAYFLGWFIGRCQERPAWLRDRKIGRKKKEINRK